MQSGNNVTKCLRILCKYINGEINSDAQTDAGFEVAYLNDHVTCEDGSADNVLLDGCMSTPCQINRDLMITAVTASNCKLTKCNITLPNLT
jgi:hypothetical protein